MKVKWILFLLTIFLLCSCKKDGKGCWQAFNPQGYDERGLVLCDKTKAEAEAAYPQLWFYRIGERKYCWRVQIGTNTFYADGIPKSMAEKTVASNGAYHFTKIECGSFCHCLWYEKHKSKITGEYAPTRGIYETILSADSCSKLFVGRVIIISETADSLFTRELSSKTP